MSRIGPKYVLIGTDIYNCFLGMRSSSVLAKLFCTQLLKITGPSVLILLLGRSKLIIRVRQ